MYFRIFSLSCRSVPLWASTSSASLLLSIVSFTYFLAQLAPPHCSSFSVFFFQTWTCLFVFSCELSFFLALLRYHWYHWYITVHLRCTVCGFDTFTYCKMISISQHLITMSFLWEEHSRSTLLLMISFAMQRASLMAQLVKNLPAMWETWVRPLG